MTAGIILIDDRAGSSDLISHPPLSTSATLCRLDSADVCITGHGPSGPILVGVEVKSLSDLISSLSNGRLPARQIRAMLAEYDISYLLIYGVYRCGSDGSLETLRGKSWYPTVAGPYGYLQIEAGLMAIEDVGVRVKHISVLAKNGKDGAIAQCARWIGHLAHRYGKEWDKHSTFQKFDNSRRISRSSPVTVLPVMDEDVRKRAEVAAKLPGVGYKRGVAAAKHFPSILDMAIATGREWAEVAGVGKVVGGSVEGSVRAGSGIPVGVDLRRAIFGDGAGDREIRRMTGGSSGKKKGKTAGQRRRR